MSHRSTQPTLSKLAMLIVVAGAAALMLSPTIADEKPTQPEPDAKQTTPAETSSTEASDQTTAAQTSKRRVDLYGDSLPRRALARLGTKRYRHNGWYKRAEFIPGTHKVVMVAKGEGIKVWDADSGKQTDFGRFDANKVQAFDVAHDGSRLAALVQTIDARVFTSKLVVWDIVTGRIVADFESKTQPARQLTRVAISPDGKLLAAGSYDGHVSVLDIALKKELANYATERNEMRSVAFSPDGKWLALANRRVAMAWDWKSGDAPIRVTGREFRPMSVGFSPDSQLLAVGGDERRGFLTFDLKAKSTVWRTEESASSYYPEQVAFSADGRHAVIPLNQHGHRIEIRDARSGKLVRKLESRGIPMRSVAVSSDGKLVVGLGSESAFFVWELETGKPISTSFAGHSEPPTHIRFSGDGKVVVTSTHAGSIRVWNAMSGEPLHLLRPDTNRGIVGLAVSADGKLAATNAFDRTVRLWDLDTGKQIFRLLGHAEMGAYRSNDIAFQSNNKFISYGGDLFLRTWDARNGRAVAEERVMPAGVFERGKDGELRLVEGKGQGFPGHSGPESAFENVKFSADGLTLAIHEGSAVHLFDTATGKKRRQIATTANRVRDIALSSNGQRVAVFEARRQQDKTYVSDLRFFENGQLIHEIKSNAWRAGITFSPDGRLVAAGMHYQNGDERSYRILVWDFESGQQVTRIVTQNGVSQMEFSPDGKRLATSHNDTTVLIWDLKP